MKRPYKKQPMTTFVRVKASFAGVVIGFNNSSIPLGLRGDIDDIYSFAKSNYPKWLEYFEVLTPDAAERIERVRVDSFLANHKNVFRNENSFEEQKTKNDDKGESTTTEGEQGDNREQGAEVTAKTPRSKRR